MAEDGGGAVFLWQPVTASARVAAIATLDHIFIFIVVLDCSGIMSSFLWQGYEAAISDC
jgi:hypothetical protein